MNRQSRWFVITNWNLNTISEYEAIMKKNQIRYIAYGKEVCPETGREHHQAFIYFHKTKGTGKTNLNKIGNMFGPIHCYVAPMLGRVIDNEEYCSKEGRYTKLGSEPLQGCREDIMETKEAIINGHITPDEIFLQNPAYGHQYGRTFDRIYSIYLQKQYRTHQTKGVWIVGPSGSGKSRLAFKDFSPEHTFVKDLTVEWFDGYNPLKHKKVILNDFRGSDMKLNDLLTLCDGCPRYVKIRGKASVPFLAETLVVTSIFTPLECYAEAIERQGEAGEQLTRRFQIINIENVNKDLWVRP